MRYCEVTRASRVLQSGTMNDKTHTPPHELIPFATATHLVPGRPNISTLWRWARRGVRSRGGSRVRLKHVRLGGRLFTSSAWLGEFGEALAAADAAHFDNEADPGASAGAINVRGASPQSDCGSMRDREVTAASRDLSRIARELAEEGL